MEGDTVQAAKFVSAGLSRIGALSSGVGIGLCVSGVLLEMSSDPDQYDTFLRNQILGIAFLMLFVPTFGTAIERSGNL